MALTVDSILKLPTSKKILILIGILFVIVILYWYLFYSPHQDEMRKLRADMDKLTKELNEGKAIARDLEKFKSQVAKLNVDLEKALIQLPSEKEIPEILKSISRLGKESNLEFTLFKPNPEAAQEFYAIVPIDLVILGKYHNVGVFFDKITKLPRIINVVDFNMSRFKDPKAGKDIKEGEADILLRTSCLINTYRFIPKKAEEKKPEKKQE